LLAPIEKVLGQTLKLNPTMLGPAMKPGSIAFGRESNAPPPKLQFLTKKKNTAEKHLPGLYNIYNPNNIIFNMNTINYTFNYSTNNIIYNTNNTISNINTINYNKNNNIYNTNSTIFYINTFNYNKKYL